ncbi:type II toxin-antitoxin system RelE/ParE family toxin [Runella sp.]|uniref:type II toxin-antitoxin system RelE/ParE family toxin n=1 Tax=Runella sp. TaxID=1960881 RepID=UPI003D117808
MNIIISEKCKKEIRQLSKKYRSIINDFETLVESLEQDPFQGSPLGKNCYKVRMSIASKNQGKSGGARVITCVKIVNDVLYLLSVYDKSEKETLDEKELDVLIKMAGI